MGSTHTVSELRPDLVFFLSFARWTSALQLRGREFCFILNRAVRGDEPPLADPTAGLSRGINKLCVSVPPRPPFPPGDVCLRGGGFDDRYRRCAAASLSRTLLFVTHSSWVACVLCGCHSTLAL